nr:hypothetical transcript [Hymenolepis microstoma]
MLETFLPRVRGFRGDLLESGSDIVRKCKKRHIGTRFLTWLYILIGASFPIARTRHSDGVEVNECGVNEMVIVLGGGSPNCGSFVYSILLNKLQFR